MSNKEYLVKKICKKSNINFQNDFFDNQKNIAKHNDTVSKYFLESLANKYEIIYAIGITKGELALEISKYLNANCTKGKGKDIGEADQIAKSYLEKINTKIT